MARTNEPDVRAIIDTVLTGPQVDAFIDDANLWVTDFLAGQDGITDARLEQVEKYLAAHFITVRDPRMTEKDADDVRERYQRGKGHVTEYLRLAAAADPTGTVRGRLVNQEGAPVVRFRAGTYDPPQL